MLSVHCRIRRRLAFFSCSPRRLKIVFSFGSMNIRVVHADCIADCGRWIPRIPRHPPNPLLHEEYFQAEGGFVFVLRFLNLFPLYDYCVVQGSAGFVFSAFPRPQVLSALPFWASKRLPCERSARGVAFRKSFSLLLSLLFGPFICFLKLTCGR